MAETLAENTGPAPEMSTNPRLAESYASLDNLMDDLNTWGRAHGMGFVKRRTIHHKEGQPTRATMSCDRGYARARLKPRSVVLRPSKQDVFGKLPRSVYTEMTGAGPSRSTIRCTTTSLAA